MDAKPADFFIGALDFFAVLVPGALLAFVCAPWALREVFGPLLPQIDTDAKAWIAYALGAYGAGHVLHAVGSVLDLPYDKLYVTWKRRRGEELVLVRTREAIVKDLRSNQRAPSAFMWAGSFVRLRSPTAGLELDRIGGDSKFFRSLCVLAFAAAVVFAFKGVSVPAVAALVGAVFSCLRFFKLRWDATQRTYEYFLLLRHCERPEKGKDHEA